LGSLLKCELFTLFVRLLCSEILQPYVTHDQLREGANEEFYGGWPMILSGLKTRLETGEVLTTPGSLKYT